MTNLFQSFSESGLGGFIESPLGARGGLIDLDPIFFGVNWIKQESGGGGALGKSPADSIAEAFTNLKAFTAWSGFSAGLSYCDDKWGTIYDTDRRAGLIETATLTAAQVTDITTDATTAKLEVITAGLIDDAGASEFIPTGGATVTAMRFNLSLSATTYSGPKDMYDDIAEGSAKAVSLGAFISTIGDDYERGIITISGLDISQFSSVTTSDRIRLWGGTNSTDVPPGIVQAPGDPRNFICFGMSYGGAFNGDRFPENSDPDIFARIVFQKPG